MKGDKFNKISKIPSRLRLSVMAGMVFMMAISYTGDVFAHPHPGTDPDHVHDDDMKVHMIGESLDGSAVDAVSLANKIEAGGIVIDKATVRYTGSNDAVGIFDNGHSVGRFELDSGIMLSTGYAKAAEQDNDFPKFSIPHSLPGDADLDSLVEDAGYDTSVYGTHDAAVLEFEFTAAQPLLCVRYIFASEEYKEFVGVGIDDVFAFLVRKKGDADWINISKVPNTDDNVSIDNINSGKNSEYYRDNEYNPDDIKPFQFDGFTRTMCAGVENCEIIAGETYEIKLAIADIYDDEIDTAVFIDAITDSPDYLHISTFKIESAEVGTTVFRTIEAGGSEATDFIWTDCTETSPGECSCVTEMSPGLPSDLLVGNCPVITSSGSKSAEFSWTLPVVPEGEYINFSMEVWDAEENRATAEWQYTDPDVVILGSGSGGGASAGGGGCFITSAANGNSFQLNPGIAFLMMGFAAMPVVYRRFKK